MPANLLDEAYLQKKMMIPIEVITVRSFDDENTYYTISLNVSSGIFRHNCPFMTDYDTVYKQMFSAER